jgi:hypothetical protein
MFAALLATLLSCQEPAPAPAPAPASDIAVPAGKVVAAWDAKTAKAAIQQLTRSLKDAANLAQRSAALEPLAAGSSALLVKPLVRIVETEKSIVIQRRAAELLGNQPAEAANPALRKLLRHARVRGSGPVLAEIVGALARCGYDKSQWSDIGDLFEQSYAAEFLPVHIAVLDLAAAHKEVQALPLLLRNLDEPVPTDVDAAHNPPAEYWKARWTAWSTWRAKVQQALFAITGQRFGSAAEARAWLDKNPR